VRAGDVATMPSPPGTGVYLRADALHPEAVAGDGVARVAL